MNNTQILNQAKEALLKLSDAEIKQVLQEVNSYKLQPIQKFLKDSLGIIPVG